MKTPRSTKNAERGAAEQGKREFTGNSPLALVSTAIQNAALRLWCVTPSSWCRGTIRLKPKGPVRRNTFSEAVAAPTEKRGFVTPNLWSWCACTASLFWSVVGVIRKDARTASDVFLTTTLHPTRVETLTVALVTPEGAKTMTATNVASASARTPTTTPTTGKTPTHFDPVATHFEAVNACAMARWYAARYEHTKAARKAAQGLSALRKLQAFEATSASPCTGCSDNRPLPKAMDFFDTQVVADYVSRRTACTSCPAADKPCLKGGAA